MTEKATAEVVTVRRLSQDWGLAPLAVAGGQVGDGKHVHLPHGDQVPTGQPGAQLLLRLGSVSGVEG